MNATSSDLTLDQIMVHFGTDDAAREYLEAVRWPDGPVCAHCGETEKVKRLEGKSHRPGLYQCYACNGQFTVTVGTIFEKSKVPLGKWLVAWYMLCSSKKGVSALQIQRMLGLGSYRTAWLMMHRIRYALRDPVFADKLGGGGGTVEADETYVGGKVKGMGRAYKGNKTPVVALVERGGRVRSRSVAKVTSKTLKRALDEHLDPSAHLMTDDLAGYRKLGKRFASRRSVNHSAGEYVRGEVHTNTVEGFFALFKRGVHGTFHHIGHKYMDQYLAEFDFRYSHRHVTDGARAVAGLKKVEGKRLMLRRPNAGR